MDLKPFYHVRLRLIGKHSEKPLQGDRYQVLLYDNDILNDDYLGAGTPDAEGYVNIRFHAGQFQSAEILPEEFPDLYFRLMVNDREVFRSPTAFRIDPMEVGDFDWKDGLLVDMGTWIVEG